jgi:H+/Cl- antiporter ClcA
MAQLFAGSYLYLGYPKLAPFSLHLLPFSILVGFLCSINEAGGAGGIFAQALAAGASIGKTIAHAVGFAEPTLFVVLGMIAFLTGLTHAPFTAFVLVLEMTDRHSAIMPMMVAACGSHDSQQTCGRGVILRACAG